MDSTVFMCACAGDRENPAFFFSSLQKNRFDKFAFKFGDHVCVYESLWEFEQTHNCTTQRVYVFQFCTKNRLQTPFFFHSVSQSDEC